MSAMDSDSKTNNAAHGGRLLRLVRRLLVMLEGTDYKERFERLAKHYALDLTEAHESPPAEKSL